MTSAKCWTSLQEHSDLVANLCNHLERKYGNITKHRQHKVLLCYERNSEDHLCKSEIIKELEPFLVGPLRVQEWNDSSRCQQLRTGIYYVKRLEPKIKVCRGFHSNVTYDIIECEELCQIGIAIATAT